MGAVTYPKAEVISYLNTELVPLRLPPSGPRSDAFFIRWTPSLLILDKSGKEHQRQVGFLPPEHFLPALMLGNAKASFAHGDFAGALAGLERLLNEHPQSFAAAEAVYLRGVCLYRTTKDASNLKKGWQKLSAEYPASEWAQRAAPYRLLP